ncbi:MAG: glycosyltransferase family A protein [Verrucomicrobiota bacterium]
MASHDHSDSRISVVIPVFNGARYLAEAIESVLGQTLKAAEIIVVDDGSADGSGDVARRFPGVRVETQPHAGIGAARNRGVTVSTGAFIAFLDADDLWLPDKLAVQAELLRTDATVDAVFGSYEAFVSPDLDADTRARLSGRVEAAGTCHAGAMLIRRPALLRAGLFPTNVAVGEFMDWFMRAQEIGLVMRNVPALVMRRRVHGGNTTLQRQHALSDYTRVLKRALDRRRAGAPKGG